MKSFTLSIVSLFFLLMTETYAQDIYKSALLLESNLEEGKKTYRLCATCHLDNGFGKINGSFPVIASQHQSVVIKQLKDIQNKYRQNPTMYPFSDPATIGGIQAIADVSAYIESLPSNQNNGIGPGDNLTNGKILYLNNCTGCHGLEGQGDTGKVFPKIKGQHYQYLLRQLKWIRDEYRTNGNPDMLILIKNMSDAELSDLADYISRL